MARNKLPGQADRTAADNLVGPSITNSVVTEHWSKDSQIKIEQVRSRTLSDSTIQTCKGGMNFGHPMIFINKCMSKYTRWTTLGKEIHLLKKTK
jgi:hypothetical protein